MPDTPQFDVIYADWPQPYSCFKDQDSRTADAHYPPLQLDQMCALDVARLCAPKAMLFFWITPPNLLDASPLKPTPAGVVAASWGFDRFITQGFDFVKRTNGWAARVAKAARKCAVSTEVDVCHETILGVADHFHFGMGHYTRANSEPCLLFSRGGGLGTPDNRGVRALVVEAIGAHSHKPNRINHDIRALYPGARCLELFARDKVEGWSTWGNAVENDVRMPLRPGWQWDHTGAPITPEAWELLIAETRTKDLAAGTDRASELLYLAGWFNGH